MISKADLSDKLLQLIVEEMPLDDLTSKSTEESKKYLDTFTDAMTAVTARIVIAYIGTAMANDPLMDEEEIINISDMVHLRLSRHLDLEANSLMGKLQRPHFDA